jgi:hypothetical protein
MLATDRSRSAGRMGRSAGSVLRSLRRLWGGWGFRAARWGFLVIASKACCGPIPLRFAYWGGNKNGGPALEGRTAVPKTAQEFLSQP